MFTYGLWIAMCDFNFYTKPYTKMCCYAFSIFSSIITIPLDIITLPFQLIGIIIFLITNRKGK